MLYCSWWKSTSSLLYCCNPWPRAPLNLRVTYLQLMQSLKYNVKACSQIIYRRGACPPKWRPFIHWSWSDIHLMIASIMSSNYGNLLDILRWKWKPCLRRPAITYNIVDRSCRLPIRHWMMMTVAGGCVSSRACRWWRSFQWIWIFQSVNDWRHFKYKIFVHLLD